jgi:hypothetical protein
MLTVDCRINGGSLNMHAYAPFSKRRPSKNPYSGKPRGATVPEPDLHFGPIASDGRRVASARLFAFMLAADQHGRVHGISQLRVADASVTPTIPSANQLPVHHDRRKGGRLDGAGE